MPVNIQRTTKQSEKKKVVPTEQKDASFIVKEKKLGNTR